MHLYQVLKRPVVTEKSQYQGDLYERQYVFEVDKRANKQLVKAAVEKIFDVDVLQVRIINVKPKSGRYGRRVVIRKPGWKKAIVTLAAGQSIQIFEGV